MGQISTAVLLGLAFVTAVARLYVRLVVQRQAGVDDAFIIFAFMCLTAAAVMTYAKIEELYIGEAFLVGLNGFIPPADAFQEIFDYKTFETASWILLWAAISSVKFSFLFLFKKLIDRIPPMLRYWWVAFLVNVVVFAFGIPAVIVGCPYFGNNLELCKSWSSHCTIHSLILHPVKCSTPAYQNMLLRYAAAQMCLDIIGDLMSTLFNGPFMGYFRLLT